MGFIDSISGGLTRSRNRLKEQINVLLNRGPDLDEEFWENLEEVLILADIGAMAACEIVKNLREQATRRALAGAWEVIDLLNEQIAESFALGGEEILGGDPAILVFVGINGTGKTTTVGKIAKQAHDAGRSVLLGSADTFRAAACEQLEIWAQRAHVPICTRERGSDPASVCYDTIEEAERIGADLILFDTAGRLHTSADLMRELEKIVNVVRKRAHAPVYVVLVIDATTGQNALVQAREFNQALDLDGVIVTKLDGTAKGGITLAVSHELNLPVLKVGVGEGLDDLKDFDAHVFAAALVGDFEIEEAAEEEAPQAEEAPVQAEEVPQAEEAPQVQEEEAPQAEKAQVQEAPQAEEMPQEILPQPQEDVPQPEEVLPDEPSEPKDVPATKQGHKRKGFFSRMFGAHTEQNKQDKQDKQDDLQDKEDALQTEEDAPAKEDAPVEEDNCHV